MLLLTNRQLALRIPIEIVENSCWVSNLVNRKDKEIHSLKAELATTKKELSEAKARIKELEGGDGDYGPRADPGNRR